MGTQKPNPGVCYWGVQHEELSEVASWKTGGNGTAQIRGESLVLVPDTAD